MQIFVELARLMLRFFYANEFVAILILLTLEEAGVPLPLPGDTLLIAAGTRPQRTLLYDLAIMGTASLAVFLGSSLLCFLMRRHGRVLLTRYGRFLPIKQERLARMEQWFRRSGPKAIVFGRLIPGLRIPTTVMAGLAGVPYRTFAPTTALAAVIWSALYFFLGAVLERTWRFTIGIVLDLLDDVSRVTLLAIALVLALSIFGWVRLRGRTPLSDSP